MSLLNIFIKSLIFIIMFFISVAFMTLLERKVLSIIGLRLGPNKSLIVGLIQPIYDAVKISQKQTNVLSNFSFFFFYFSSIFMIFMSLMMISTFNLNSSFLDWKASLVILMLFFSLHTLCIVIIGWSSYSKYSIISMLRVISQLISYEIVIYMLFMFILLFYSSFSFVYMNYGYVVFIYMPLVFLFWIISVLSEVSRSPLDFSESESELVSGFNIDFGSKLFSIIFLSEYANLIFMSLFSSIVFFNFNFEFIFLFFVLVYFTILWIRSLFPRIRYDLFMMFSWKFMMPWLTLYLILFIYY